MVEEFIIPKEEIDKIIETVFKHLREKSIGFIKSV